MKTSVTLVGVYTYMSKLPSTHLEDAMASQVCGLQIIGSHSSYQKYVHWGRCRMLCGLTGSQLYALAHFNLADHLMTVGVIIVQG